MTAGGGNGHRPTLVDRARGVIRALGPERDLLVPAYHFKVTLYGGPGAELHIQHELPNTPEHILMVATALMRAAQMMASQVGAQIHVVPPSTAP